MFRVRLSAGTSGAAEVAPPIPTPAAITSLAVLGPTPLPDGSDAAIPNGWVARATLSDDGVSAFDPAKIVLTVNDLGFDTNGNAVTVARTVRGTAIVRRQYPNKAQRLNEASGGVRTVYFALSEEIYAGSVIAAATAEAGYYGGAASGAIGGVANESTVDYPKPLLAWLDLQHERATGASFAVEAAVYHALARNGQQVACVEFYGRDAQASPNVTPVQRASQPALSSIQTQGPIVEAWKAAIPLAALTQGDLCQVIARVKPWIGPAFDLAVAGAGVYGTLTPGTAADTAQPETPLRFLNDKTGGYGGLEAWVRAGASGGAVGSGATPFPTIASAMAALAAANNAQKGHNDHSGSTVYLMDDGAGGAVDHAITRTDSVAAGHCWSDVRVDPAAVGAVRIAITATGVIQTANLLRIRCPLFMNASGNTGFDGGGTNTKKLAFDGATLIGRGTNSSIPLTYRTGLCYFRNVTFQNFRDPFWPFSTERSCAALVLSCTGNLVAESRAAPYAFIGNRLEGLRIFENQASNTAVFPHDGAIVANNLMLKCPQVNKPIGDRPIAGFARVQNVFETAGYANSPGFQVAADGLTQPLAGFVSMHNTMPGVGVGSSNIARQNAAYTDAAGSAGVQKRMLERFDLLHQRNIKTDTFTTVSTVTGRTGNWSVRYGVGALGNVVVTGDANAALGADADGGNWLGEYLEPGSAWRAGEANVTFADNRSGSAGAGVGDYRLTGAVNAAYARVPAGRGVLRFDLAGTARRQDGTGASGAYERAD